MPCVCKFHLPSSHKRSTLTFVGKNLLKTFPYYTCLTYPMDPIAISSLSAGTVVGISITILLESFSAGVLLTAIITYCCWVRSGKSSWQTHISPSEGPMCDEVGQDQDQYAWDKGESRIWDGSRQAGDGGSYVCSSGYWLHCCIDFDSQERLCTLVLLLNSCLVSISYAANWKFVKKLCTKCIPRLKAIPFWTKHWALQLYDVNFTCHSRYLAIYNVTCYKR